MRNKLFSTEKVFNDFSISTNSFSEDLLRESSLSESATLLSGVLYKEVNLYYLDLSTNSITGTFKDWVACATVAYCKQHGIKRFVTQSSGNTANALAIYCQRFGIKVDIFYLSQNKYKIKPRFFYRENTTNERMVTLHEVKSSEADMKTLTKDFSQKHEVPWLPNLDIQIDVNSIRADLVHSLSKKNKIKFDWVAQALSSGFGVFGFYNGLRRLKVSSSFGYKFIGVQQTAVCPFIKKFSPELLLDYNLSQEKIIERTLFRSVPTNELYQMMESILAEYGGEFSVVSNSIYSDLLPQASNMLKESGIILSQNDKGDFYEKSGIINLIGVLRLVDNGVINKGDSVLVVITGGCDAPMSDLVKPDYSYQ